MIKYKVMGIFRKPRVCFRGLKTVGSKKSKISKNRPSSKGKSVLQKFSNLNLNA